MGAATVCALGEGGGDGLTAWQWWTPAEGCTAHYQHTLHLKQANTTYRPWPSADTTGSIVHTLCGNTIELLQNNE